ncbi:hypothetical protein [Clostridium cellulovorans]|uniref:Flagellar hook-length control protein FliK n=1 Tax=Clostridium cellulovorans (strain ATCC 35296 / DSM 3052 / OCM 3 / 743B) TaxID=573061 RepID=D9SRS5_CLOC7|nr:hypothetical protein [Clostridium cellulovorans]ADL50442.1 hypothetical protein Clocel_0671 [Clostridium cellulovorans 743B]
MAAINRIPGNLNVEEKRNTRKMSFTKGDVFNGAVVDSDSAEGEVTIKIANRWQIQAKVEGDVDLKAGQNRFKVVGFEDGKLKLQVVDNSVAKEVETTSLDEIIKNAGLEKEDRQLLSNMLKHNMPLTRENILEVKNLFELNRNLKDANYDVNALINKLVDSKGIDVNSKEGIALKEMIEKLFTNIKGLSQDKIMLMLENNLDLTSDNIESLNRILAGKQLILNDIADLFNSSEALKDTEVKTNQQVIVGQTLSTEAEIGEAAGKFTNLKNMVENNDVDNIIHEYLSKKGIENLNSKGQEAIKELKNILVNLKYGNMDEEVNNILSSNPKVAQILNDLEELATPRVSLTELIASKAIIQEDDISLKNSMDILKETGIKVTKENISTVDTMKNLKELLKDNSVETVKAMILGDEPVTAQMDKKVTELLTNLKSKDLSTVLQGLKGNPNGDTLDADITKLLETVKNKDLLSNKDLINHKDISNTSSSLSSAENVKEQLGIKMDSMKEMINSILSKGKMSPELYANFKDAFNDFKMFNSLSQNYYMLDVPINLYDNQYQCKLLIKDEREKGKRIDSKNVKIVATVETNNMGAVDAYINVKDKTMWIDIKSDKQWTNIFRKTSGRLESVLADMGYFPMISVTEKKSEADIISTREFFNEEVSYGLNIKV